jgi:O-antigen/teichoic acid export membrane protein
LVLILAKIQISQTGFRFETKLLKELMLYGTPLVISAMAAYALLSADRWMINMVSTPEALGLYAVGKKLAYISFILIQPFCLWWSALRFKKLNMPGGKESVAHTTSLGIALAIIFCALVCIGSPIIVDLFINDSYDGALIYLPALALIFAVKQIAELANLGCYIGRTTWNVMAIDLFSAAVSITCLIFLGKLWSINGVIASLLIAQTIRFLAFYYVSQQVLHLSYAKGKLAVLVAICLGLTYVSWQIEILLHHFVMLCVSTSIVTAYLHYSGMFNLEPLVKRCIQMVRPAAT